MSMKCPIISKTLIIADDAQLAAHVSCAVARSASYLPIMDGPRLTRPDRQVEVIRRNNAAARAKPDHIILAGLSDESYQAIVEGFTPGLRQRIKRISASIELGGSADGTRTSPPPLRWGRDRIGIGLLKALRSRSGITFSDEASPIEHIAPKSDHLVVCEQGEDLSEVIAANYAFALGAGLHLIPQTADPVAEDILERFYSVMDQTRMAATDALTELKAELRDRCGPIAIPPGGSITFVTRRLPYGFAFPEVPSTHLFAYPDLGISIINGFSAEQPEAAGVGVAVLVDPGATKAPDIDAAERLLPPRGMLVRAYEAENANLRAVTDMIELFPYDLLLIATHCGDAPGFRWTYEFTDPEGIDRRLVVDKAVGFAPTDDREVLTVTEFTTFVSLDGVDWRDPVAKESLHVGRAVLDFMERTATGAINPLEPVTKENIPRVVGSAVLQMYDNNYISLPRPIADHRTPIVISNACSSWHRLAENYMFSNARMYIGTLFPVLGPEAHDIIVKLFDKHFGKPFAGALWSAQREIYRDSIRRPYIVTGVYPQRLRSMHADVPRYVAARLLRALRQLKAHLREADAGSERSARNTQSMIQYYERELRHMRERWPHVFRK